MPTKNIFLTKTKGLAKESGRYRVVISLMRRSIHKVCKALSGIADSEEATRVSKNDKLGEAKWVDKLRYLKL